MPPFERAVHAAVGRGMAALLAMQDPDGLWREFELKPGPAEAWTTAWVGWCLTRCHAPTAAMGGDTASCWTAPATQRRLAWSCARAARAVHDLRRPDGWGYNRASGADADSTAWAIRFLAACGTVVDPLPWLERHVDAAGGVHTFVDDGYGSWTDAHDDVAATVGLALLSAPRSRPLARRIAEGLARRWPVRTFWWSTSSYGAAWSLRLLATLAHGVPAAMRGPATSWLDTRPAAEDAFDAAHRLMIATALGDRPRGEALVNQLLDLSGDAGWPGACHLLVPPREDDEPSTPPHRELKGVLTTSLSVFALAEFMGWRAGRA